MPPLKTPHRRYNSKLDFPQIDDELKVQVVIADMTVRQKNLCRVLNVIRYEPRITIQEISFKTGLSCSTVHKCVRIIREKIHLIIIAKPKDTFGLTKKIKQQEV